MAQHWYWADRGRRLDIANISASRQAPCVAVSRLGTLNLTATRVVMLIQVRGSSRVSSVEGVFDLMPGDWLVLDRDSKPLIQSDANGLCVGMFIPPHQELGAPGRFVHLGFGHLRPVDQRMLFRLWRQTLDAAVNGEDSGWECQSLLRYFSGLQRDLQAQVQRCPGRTTLHRLQIFSRLQRTRLYLQGHRNSTTRSTELALVARLSSCYFSRTYTAVYDERPQATSSRLRLEYAARQLITTSQPIADIALSAGFENCCSFARAFRAYFGMAASQYRRDTRDAGGYLHELPKPPAPVERPQARKSKAAQVLTRHAR